MQHRTRYCAVRETLIVRAQVHHNTGRINHRQCDNR